MQCERVEVRVPCESLAAALEAVDGAASVDITRICCHSLCYETVFPPLS